MLTDFSSLYKGVTLYVSTVPEGQKTTHVQILLFPLNIRIICTYVVRSDTYELLRWYHQIILFMLIHVLHKNLLVMLYFF